MPVPFAVCRYTVRALSEYKCGQCRPWSDGTCVKIYLSLHAFKMEKLGKSPGTARINYVVKDTNRPMISVYVCSKLAVWSS